MERAISGRVIEGLDPTLVSWDKVISVCIGTHLSGAHPRRLAHVCLTRYGYRNSPRHQCPDSARLPCIGCTYTVPRSRYHPAGSRPVPVFPRAIRNMSVTD